MTIMTNIEEFERIIHKVIGPSIDNDGKNMFSISYAIKGHNACAPSGESYTTFIRSWIVKGKGNKDKNIEICEFSLVDAINKWLAEYQKS